MSKSKTAVVIRHAAFEDLGTILFALDHNGFHINYLEAGYDPITDDDADLLVVLGGPISVYDEDKYPFLRDEIDLLERRLAADRPILGICLGAQLMARALGERVYPAPVKELGWEPLTLTEAGRNSLLWRIGPDRCSMFHWHGDTFDLPKGASLLASTSGVTNQVFACGSRSMGFQCHPEVTARKLERWYIGHACELSHSSGVTVQGLRADAARFAGALEDNAELFFDDWSRKCV